MTYQQHLTVSTSSLIHLVPFTRFPAHYNFLDFLLSHWSFFLVSYAVSSSSILLILEFPGPRLQPSLFSSMQIHVLVISIRFHGFKYSMWASDSQLHISSSGPLPEFQTCLDYTLNNSTVKFLKHRTRSICWQFFDCSSLYSKSKVHLKKKTHKVLYDLTPLYFSHFLSTPLLLTPTRLCWPPYHSSDTSSILYSPPSTPHSLAYIACFILLFLFP